MNLHWLAHVYYILSSIHLLKRDVQQRTDLTSGTLVYDGALRRLHTIFESTYKLPDVIKKQHSHLPWPKYKELRNFLVHEYLGDFTGDDAWALITETLPPLQEAMLQHLPDWQDLRDTFETRA